MLLPPLWNGSPIAAAPGPADSVSSELLDEAAVVPLGGISSRGDGRPSFLAFCDGGISADIVAFVAEDQAEEAS